MMIRRCPILIPVLACAALWLAACSSATIRVPVTRPAEIDLGGVRRIAVGQVSGIGSVELAEELTVALFDTRRFEMLDRQHLDHIMRELRISASEQVDAETAVELGRLVGSAALVFGRVSDHSFEESLAISDLDTGKDGRAYRTYTRRGTARVAATLQITELGTGRIIAIRRLAATRSAERSARDRRPEALDADALLAAARAECVADFLRAVAPHAAQETVAFEKDDAPEIERGIQFARGGDLDRAATAFREAVARNAENTKASYNLGLALMCLGRYDEAIAVLDQAYGATASRKYGRALARARAWQQNADRLRRQDGASDGAP